MKLENNFKGFVRGEMNYFDDEQKVKVSFPVYIDKEILIINDFYGENDLKLVYLDSEGVYLNTHYWDTDEEKWERVSFEKSKRIKIIEKISVEEYIRINFW